MLLYYYYTTDSPCCQGGFFACAGADEIDPDFHFQTPWKCGLSPKQSHFEGSDFRFHTPYKPMIDEILSSINAPELSTDTALRLLPIGISRRCVQSWHSTTRLRSASCLILGRCGHRRTDLTEQKIAPAPAPALDKPQKTML